MSITYTPFSTNTSDYGWAGMLPLMLAHRLSLANARFKKLKNTLGVDAIAFCGSSGCAIAFNLATRHKIPLIYVRKKGEKSHGSKVECNAGRIPIAKYLIVDDFVDQGSTVDHIINSINKHAKKVHAVAPEQVGVLCFDTYVDRDRDIETYENTIKLFTCDR
jgi:adenine/guanine phosphoribosyltransferase-like PRPP-binding protein